MNNFYIYCHIKKTDGKCFYVGKGKGNRHNQKTSRNQYWHNIVNKHGFEVIILVNNISEEKAFELESYFCEQIGYENLCNLRKENGWGGWSHSLETKQKMSSSHIGKKKQWVTDYKLGRKDSEETRLKKKQSKSDNHKLNLSKNLKDKTKGRIITWKVGRNLGQKSNYDYSKRYINYKGDNMGYKGKKLYQLDLEGNIVKIWDNKNQAAKILGFNKICIGNVCLGKQKSYKNYIWKYGK